MQPSGLLAILGTLAAFVAQANATPTRPVLVPRASPQPCAQKYVCPTPRPYDPVQFPDLGDDPGPTRFRCRIGWSIADPNFAFCIYEKDTGNLVGSSPPGYEPICWERGMPNPECSGTPTRRALPVRPRRAVPEQLGARVAMERFTNAKKK